MLAAGLSAKPDTGSLMTSRSATRTQTVPPPPRPHPPQPELAAWPLRASLYLGALPTAPGCGRAWTRQILQEWDLGHLVDNTTLLVSELTTNAVQASAPITGAAIGLWLASDCERTVILVWDSSPQPPTPANPGEDTENGRGLLLVDVLSLQWGWYFPASASPLGRDGKVSWAILE